MSTPLGLTAPDRITWYDVLGVAPGASLVTLRRARDERLRQLRPDLLADAPPPVPGVASRAAAAIEAAWDVLADRERRKGYDARLGRLRAHGGRLVVPDVRGLSYRSCLTVVVTSGLRPAVVGLTENPLPVEGLVVGQSPEPGRSVRYQSTLTMKVWHPARGC
jgi:DnaJ domain/PASTA domain